MRYLWFLLINSFSSHGNQTKSIVIDSVAMTTNHPCIVTYNQCSIFNQYSSLFLLFLPHNFYPLLRFLTVLLGRSKKAVSKRGGGNRDSLANHMFAGSSKVSFFHWLGAPIRFWETLCLFHDRRPISWLVCQWHHLVASTPTSNVAGRGTKVTNLVIVAAPLPPL